jgi:hypothetical protein
MHACIQSICPRIEQRCVDENLRRAMRAVMLPLESHSPQCTCVIYQY